MKCYFTKLTFPTIFLRGIGYVRRRVTLGLMPSRMAALFRDSWDGQFATSMSEDHTPGKSVFLSFFFFPFPLGSAQTPFRCGLHPSKPSCRTGFCFVHTQGSADRPIKARKSTNPPILLTAIFCYSSAKDVPDSYRDETSCLHEKLLRAYLCAPSCFPFKWSLLQLSHQVVDWMSFSLRTLCVIAVVQE